MLKNYVPAKYRTVIDYELVFDDGRNNGFGFPCDANGELLSGMPEAAYKNYIRCVNNPTDFVRFNQVVKHKRRVQDNAHGTCICGAEVELYNQYNGACQCQCGRWYNLFGQELLPPGQWEEYTIEEDL